MSFTTPKRDFFFLIWVVLPIKKVKTFWGKVGFPICFDWIMFYWVTKSVPYIKAKLSQVDEVSKPVLLAHLDICLPSGTVKKHGKFNLTVTLKFAIKIWPCRILFRLKVMVSLSEMLCILSFKRVLHILMTKQVLTFISLKVAISTFLAKILFSISMSFKAEK